MDPDKLLDATLKSLRHPVARVYYKGNAPTHFTYQLVIGKGVAYADDDSNASETYWLVNLYSKTNYRELLKKTIQALKQAGFYGIEVGAEIYEADMGYYHIPIEFKYFMEV